MSPVLIIHFLFKVKHGNSLLPGTFKYFWLAYIYFKSLQIQNIMNKSSVGSCCLCAHEMMCFTKALPSRPSESFRYIHYKWLQNDWINKALFYVLTIPKKYLFYSLTFSPNWHFSRILSFTVTCFFIETEVFL